MWARTETYVPNNQLKRLSSAKKDADPEKAVSDAIVQILNKISAYNKEVERIKREFAEDPARAEIERKSNTFYRDIRTII